MAMLRALVVLALVCPTAGLKGFLDSLIYGHSHQKDHAQSQKNVGRTVMDAIRLAMKVGSSDTERPAPRVVQVFSKYDRDGSNSLTAAESWELLRSLGFTDAETAQMQAEMDVGHDGQVSLKEFEEYIATPEQGQAQQEPQATPAPKLPRAPAAEAAQSPPPPPPPVVAVAPAPAPVELARAAQPVPAPAPAPVKPLPPAVVPQQQGSSTKAPNAEPFGREDAARQLQDHASRTQDTLVDAFETAQLAEVKSTVFRALSRLRVAHIKEYDTIARLETQAIDAYNDKHSYRRENPIAHLSDYEGPVDGDKLTSFH